jgi:hypothetical protein
LPKKLDEEVASDMVAGFGGVITKLTNKQANEPSIMRLGWPVALPRFTKRPSDNKIK